MSNSVFHLQILVSVFKMRTLKYNKVYQDLLFWQKKF